MFQVLNHRDEEGSQAWYSPISVIEFRGRLSRNGESRGHYICDVNDKHTRTWFRTNDNCHPIQLELSDVSQNGYVVLYKRTYI